MITLEIAPEKLTPGPLPFAFEPLESEKDAKSEKWHTQQALLCKQTGLTLGHASQTLSPHYLVQFYQGKEDFCAVVKHPELTFLLLPGARFESDDTLVTLSEPTHPLPPHPMTPIDPPLPAPQQVTRQAMILGAGIASRFEPFSGMTTGYSKPAVPLLGHDSVIVCIAKHCQAHGIERLIVNTFYMPEQLKAQLSEVDGIEIVYIDEEAPSGTAGGLAKAIEQGEVNPSEPILIIQGDAVTDSNLSFLLEQHQARRAALTIGGQIIDDADVHRFGMIETDHSGPDGQSGHIIGFKEKPSLEEAGTTRFANTGFYVIDPVLFDLFVQGYQTALNESRIYDYAKDFFPMVLEQAVKGLYRAGETEPLSVWAQAMGGYWCDIGHPSQYLQSLADIDAGRVQLAKPSDWSSFYKNQVVCWPGATGHALLGSVTLKGPVLVTPTPDGVV